MSQRSLLTQTIDLVEGEHRRMDCHECGGKNTLSISNVNGVLIWHCFRASCTSRGAMPIGYTAANIASTFLRERSAEPFDNLFTVPDVWMSVLRNNDCIKYMEKNNFSHSFMALAASFRYDPQENRFVFLCTGPNGNVCGAMGRRLDNNRVSIAKWKKYYGSVYCFTAKLKKAAFSDHLVVVEDCASACAVSSLVHSMALGGTYFQTPWVGELTRYKRVIIALDPDALYKSFGMSRLVSLVSNCIIWPIQKDLKYYTLQELERLMREQGITRT